MADPRALCLKSFPTLKCLSERRDFASSTWSLPPAPATGDYLYESCLQARFRICSTVDTPENSWGERMGRTLEQSTMRKVYLRLLPFAVLSYILAYIDRINVSFAGLTMRGDLEMSAGTFGFAVGLFYWGYFIFEVPSNVILEKIDWGSLDSVKV